MWGPTLATESELPALPRPQMPPADRTGPTFWAVPQHINDAPDMSPDS
ncbi:hypothetical protein TRL7639_01585 [Falsiruegeria litorea R37]|uniref:Uncharacterized protein n=1 Tax=Falsiruegeria litorea R37 TaxID=1200284 RepID=A0A1Y5S8J0_9RHOB|nr:hypothetical protein TRL7639_01585 [Falsiruegeria litorea R37]